MSVTAPAPPHPTDGVIEEARRRQRRRRLRGVVALALAALLAGLGLALDGGSPDPSSRPRPASGAGTVNASDIHPSGFNVRLFPTTDVGEAGWCEVVEEHGITGGSACGDAPTAANPFLMVYGWGTVGSKTTTTVAVAIPEVSSIEVNGRQRVVPMALPGLPYGLRAARIVTSSSEPLAPAMRQAVRREGTLLVAFNADGRQIPDRRPFVTYRQARVRSWHGPSAPAGGSCRIAVRDMPALRAQAGKVANAIRPFPGSLIGQAFLPCVETRYTLGGGPLRVLVMLDAADPSAPVGALPNFKAVPRAAGFFSQGSLTATRDGGVWIVAGQGTGLSQRIEVLRHVSAVVRL